MVTSPIFSLPGVPAQVKVGLAVLTAWLLYPAVAGTAVPQEIWAYLEAVLAETLAGLLMGLVSTMAVSAIQIAGGLLDLEMGFAMGALFDPLAGSQVTLMGRFFNVMAMLLLLVTDGHHALLLALADSFSMVPLGTLEITSFLTWQVIGVFTGMFGLALRLAAPILAVLLMADLALGLVARTVPQINVFILGFPLKAGLGTLITAVSLPLMAEVIGEILSGLGQTLVNLWGGA